MFLAYSSRNGDAHFIDELVAQKFCYGGPPCRNIHAFNPHLSEAPHHLLELEGTTVAVADDPLWIEEIGSEQSTSTMVRGENDVRRGAKCGMGGINIPGRSQKNA